MTPQFGREEAGNTFESTSKVLAFELGAPIDDRIEAFASAGYTQADACKETWTLATVAPAPLPGFDLANNPNLLLDWSEVRDYTDIDVSRFDLGLGARYRSSGGYGLELSYLWTDYADREPILEDETGQYSRITMLASKSF